MLQFVLSDFFINPMCNPYRAFSPHFLSTLPSSQLFFHGGLTHVSRNAFYNNKNNQKMRFQPYHTTSFPNIGVVDVIDNRKRRGTNRQAAHTQSPSIS